jgi:hypothetical protein
VHFAFVTEETAGVSETLELLAAFEGALVGSIVLVPMLSAKCQYIIMKAMETGGLTATRMDDQRPNLVRNNPGVHRPFYHPCSVGSWFWSFRDLLSLPGDEASLKAPWLPLGEPGTDFVVWSGLGDAIED